VKIRGRLTAERLERIWVAFPAAYAWFLGQCGDLPPLGEALDKLEAERAAEQ
jgi:hypothetical protein